MSEVGTIDPKVLPPGDDSTLSVPSGQSASNLQADVQIRKQATLQRCSDAAMQ